MRAIIFTFFLLMTSVIYAQGILDDPKAIFISPEGTSLSRDEAGELLYSNQRYRLEKDTEKIPGKVLVKLIPISQKEFDRMIAEDQKSVKSLKGATMNQFTLLTDHPHQSKKMMQ